MIVRFGWLPLVPLVLVLGACGGGGPDPGAEGPPAAPSDVRAVPGPGYMTITWQDNSDDETGFVIHRDDGATVAVRAAAEAGTVAADAERFDDLRATVDTPYSYRVAAMNEHGASEASPGTAAARIEPGVDLMVGTNDRTGDRLGTVFIVYFVFPDALLDDPSVDFDVAITGPDGWNGGQPYEYVELATGSSREVGFDITSATSTEPVAGTYEVSVTVGPDVYTATATLPDLDFELGPPTNITITDAAPSAVTVAWDPPAGAESAWVSLWRGAYEEQLIGVSTDDTTHTFEGLSLDDGTYLIEVTPINTNIATYPLRVEPFGISYDSRSFVIGGTRTVTIAAGAVGSELESTRAGARRYEAEHPGVEVEVLESPALSTDRLAHYRDVFEAGSDELDLVQIDVVWPGDLSEHLVDLRDFGADAVAADHFDALVENNTVDDRLVALPWFTDSGLLYSRTDLLDAYGYDAPPTTWDELEDMARTIQQGERDGGNAAFWGYVWQGDDYEGLTCNALEWFASGGGGRIVELDGVITIDNPAASAMLERVAGWVGDISPAEVTSMHEESARAVFQAGDAAFMRNWTYAYALAEADGSEIQGRVAVSSLPAGPGGSSANALGGWSLAVSAYSDDAALAADVAMYLTSFEEQKARAIDAGFQPTLPDLYEDDDVLAARPEFADRAAAFANSVARPSTVVAPDYAEVSQAVSAAVHGVLTGEQEAAAALEDLEDQLVGITGLGTGSP